MSGNSTAPHWLRCDGEMARRIRARDWSTTPLGPIDRWPAVLRTTLTTVLDHPFPIVLAWGPELITLHNDAYLPLLGNKPDALGRPFLAVWDEARETIAPELARALRGESTRRAAASFVLMRNGVAEEAFFDYSFSPVRDDSGAVVGILNFGIETTQRLFVERARAEAGLQESEAKLRTLFDTMDEAFVLVEVENDAAGRAVDATYIEGNRAATRLTGLPDFHRRRLSEVAPGAERYWLEIYDRVARGGEPERLERFAGSLGRWYEYQVSRVGETTRSGAPQLAVLFQDVTERKSADAALARTNDRLRESERRFRILAETSPVGVAVSSADGLLVYANRPFEALLGYEEGSLVGLLASVVYHDPADRGAWLTALEKGPVANHEVRFRRRDGQLVWVSIQAARTEFDGQRATIGVVQDITERKNVELGLRESEERLRSATEVGRLGLWDWNVRTGEVHWSDEHFRLQGYAVGEVTPSYEAWLARIHPEDREPCDAALQEAMRERIEYIREFRVVHTDGSVHWLYGRGRFFYDEDGEPVRMIGAMIDVTDRREWAQRQQTLVSELQHRTRNLLAVVRSMATQTARASVDLEDFRDRFQDRLDALARVQGLLSRLNEHDRISFDALIRTELAAMGGPAEKVTLDGPADVRLRSSTVQTLAMALHELATNAVKYGALRRPSGHLAIRWWLEAQGEEGKPWLHIHWRETGVDMSAPPGRGQGRELIERALPYQLGAKTSYCFEPDGVHCTIAVPVSASTLG